MAERYVIFGAGGHAIGLASALPAGADITFVTLDENYEPLDWAYRPGDHLAIGFGVGKDLGVPLNRIQLFKAFPEEAFPPIVHPRAYVHESVWLGPGAQVMAGAIVQPRCHIGANVLINTGAQIDHDCVIGDHSLISPGAVLCGSVKLGDRSRVGVSASIVQFVELPYEACVPGGAIVVGPFDLRKPVRVVRRCGADEIAGCTLMGEDAEASTVDIRLHPHS